MATDVVAIVGDTSTLYVEGTTLTDEIPIVFLSGSFRGGPEERRIVSVFIGLEAETKILEMRFEYTDPLFPTTDIRGRPISNDPTLSVYGAGRIA